MSEFEDQAAQAQVQKEIDQRRARDKRKREKDNAANLKSIADHAGTIAQSVRASTQTVDDRLLVAVDNLIRIFGPSYTTRANLTASELFVALGAHEVLSSYLNRVEKVIDEQFKQENLAYLSRFLPEGYKLVKDED